MLKQRIITAIIMVVVFLTALFWLPTAGWAALVALLVWQGALEWAHLSSLTGLKVQLYAALTLALLLTIFWLDGKASSAALLPLHLLCYVASALFWLLLIPVWMKVGRQWRNKYLLFFAGWLVVLPTGLAMMDLRSSGPSVLLCAMSVVWLADTAAYFSGRKFGKHKLAPAISPGKTWEGVYGALLLVSLYVVLIGWKAAFISSPGMFIAGVLLSCIWVALSVMGDLFESMIKRQAGVKDSGTLLPGHGGLLDRIDALTSTLPLVALAMMLYRTLG